MLSNRLRFSSPDGPDYLIMVDVIEGGEGSPERIIVIGDAHQLQRDGHHRDDRDLACRRMYDSYDILVRSFVGGHFT